MPEIFFLHVQEPIYIYPACVGTVCIIIYADISCRICIYIRTCSSLQSMPQYATKNFANVYTDVDCLSMHVVIN